MAGKEHLSINLKELLEKNPNSTTLKYLLSPEYKEEERYFGSSENDWGHRLQNEIELDEPTIVAADAIAIYIRQMRPIKKECEKEVLDTIRSLHIGQKVVGYTRDYWFSGSLVNFDSHLHGVLSKEPSAVVAKSNAPYSYDLALQFEDQARPIRMRTGRWLASGEDAISELHEISLSEKKFIQSKGFKSYAPRLKNSAIMHKLGLLEGNTTFEAEREEVVEGARAALDPNNPAILEQNITLLPDLYILDPGNTENLIKELVSKTKKYPMNSEEFRTTFIDAIAEIRAPKAIFSLGSFATEAIRARASVELYDIAAQNEYIETLTENY